MIQNRLMIGPTLPFIVLGTNSFHNFVILNKTAIFRSCFAIDLLTNCFISIEIILTRLGAQSYPNYIISSIKQQVNFVIFFAQCFHFHFAYVELNVASK